MMEYAKRVCSEDYSRVWDLPNRVALCSDIRAPKIIPKPYRMFDVDEGSHKDNIIGWLEKYNIKIITSLPTPNGHHIIAEAFNPSVIKEYKQGEDYVFPDGEKCTYREECNTILYATWE